MQGSRRRRRSSLAAMPHRKTGYLKLQVEKLLVNANKEKRDSPYSMHDPLCADPSQQSTHTALCLHLEAHTRASKQGERRGESKVARSNAKLVEPNTVCEGQDFGPLFVPACIDDKGHCGHFNVLEVVLMERNLLAGDDCVFGRAFVNLDALAVDDDILPTGNLQRVPLLNRRGHGQKGWLEFSAGFAETTYRQSANTDALIVGLYVGEIRTQYKGSLRIIASLLDDSGKEQNPAQSPLWDGPPAETRSHSVQAPWWGGLLQFEAALADKVRLSLVDEAGDIVAEGAPTSVGQLIASSGSAWVHLDATSAIWLVSSVETHPTTSKGNVSGADQALVAQISWTSARAGKFYVVAHLFPSGGTRGRAKLRDVVRTLTHETQSWEDDLRVPVPSLSPKYAADATLHFVLFEETHWGAEMRGYGAVSVALILAQSKLGKPWPLDLQALAIQATIQVSGSLLANSAPDTNGKHSNVPVEALDMETSTCQEKAAARHAVRTDTLRDTEIPEQVGDQRPRAVHVEIFTHRGGDSNHEASSCAHSTIELSSGTWNAKNPLSIASGATYTCLVPVQWSEKQRKIPTLRFRQDNSHFDALDLTSLCLWPQESVQVRFPIKTSRRNLCDSCVLICRASLGRSKKAWDRPFPGGKIHVHLCDLLETRGPAGLDYATVRVHLRGSETSTCTFSRDANREGGETSWNGHCVLVCEASEDAPVIEFDVRDARATLIAEANLVLTPSVSFEGHVMNAKIPLRAPGTDVKVAKLAACIEVFPQHADDDTETSLHIGAFALETLSLESYAWAGRTALSLQFNNTLDGSQVQSVAATHEDRRSPVWDIPQKISAGLYEVSLCNDAALADSETYCVAKGLAPVDLKTGAEASVEFAGIGTVCVRTMSSKSGAIVADLASQVLSARSSCSNSITKISVPSSPRPSARTVSTSRSARSDSHAARMVRWAVLQVHEVNGRLHRISDDEFLRVNGDQIPTFTTPRGHLGAKLRIPLEVATETLRLTLCLDDAHALENEIGQSDLTLAQEVGSVTSFCLRLQHCVTQADTGIELSGDVQVFVRQLHADAKEPDSRTEVERCIKACRLKAIFYTMDVDKSGTVSRREFLTAVQHDEDLVRELGATRPERLFSRLDLDDDGVLSWTEFQRIVDFIADGAVLDDEIEDSDDEEDDENHLVATQEDARAERGEDTSRDAPGRKRSLAKTMKKKKKRKKKSMMKTSTTRNFSKNARATRKAGAMAAVAGTTRLLHDLTRSKMDREDKSAGAQPVVSPPSAFQEIELVGGDESAPPVQGGSGQTSNQCESELVVRVRELERALEVQQELYTQEKASIEAEKERVREELEHMRERADTLDQVNERRVKELELEKKRGRDLHKQMSDVTVELTSFRKLGEGTLNEEDWQLVRLQALSKEQDRRLACAREQRKIEHRAAAKLQALARSARARLAYRQERQARTKAAVALQAAARVRIAQRRYTQQRYEVTRGCTRLQAIYRGRARRTQVAMEMSSATKIQAVFRAHRGRRVARSKAREQRSASAIQAQVRRLRSMREFGKLKSAHLRRIRAAVEIQRRIRGMHARESYALRVDARRQQTLEYESATRVQSLVRGRSGRKSRIAAVAHRDTATRAARRMQRWFLRKRKEEARQVQAAVGLATMGTAGPGQVFDDGESQDVVCVPQDPISYLRVFLKSKGASGHSTQQARDIVARAVISLDSEDGSKRSLRALSSVAPNLVQTAMARRQQI